MITAPPFVILDDAQAGTQAPGAGFRLFSRPKAVITATEPEEVAAALAGMTQALGQGHHVAGYFSYELGYLFEERLRPLLPAERQVPLLWFGVFDAPEHWTAEDGLARLEAARKGRAYAGPLRPLWQEQDYAARFARLKDTIQAGDIYQGNLTFPEDFSFAGDPLALYLELRAQGGGGYSAYIDDGARHVLSFSPELFFAVHEGTLTSRPMKGTAARGANADKDAAARAQLAASPKDRAENLMIVDLIRNDLGRVTELGSIGVRNLFGIETYPTVHQMVSTISGRLRAQSGPAEILRALFPCGSITGAPKIRAMEILRVLEPRPRGLYCGAIGSFGPGGEAQFGVSIRTLTISGASGSLGVGGGVVADSMANSEYAECLLKARYFTQSRKPLSLIETLRYVPQSGFVRKNLHLARMESSAKDFGIAFDLEQALEALNSAVADAKEDQRVRLVLNERGHFKASPAPLGPVASSWRYVLSEQRIQSTDWLLRHKTDWREVYEDEYARLHAAMGCDEVLFCNERGDLAEGSRTNIFVRVGGRLLTPPLESGVLNGCLRRALLEDPSILCAEAVLHPADLAAAEAVYLGNSLRGLIPAFAVSG
jgi:para-aminobenzoate synthetase/4-amino-4-deoxychorismate lyase